MRRAPLDDQPRVGTVKRWKGKPRLTLSQQLERQREYRRKWRARNREKIRQYFRDYYAKNPGYQRERYQANLEERRAKARARCAHPEAKAKAKAYAKRYRPRANELQREQRKQDPERFREQERLRRARNPEKKRAHDRRYRQKAGDAFNAGVARAKAKKPELYRDLSAASSQRRRARLRALPVEPVSIRRLVARDASKCHLCRGHVARADRSVDHLIPVVRGGPWAEWNLAIAHDRCNKSRGTRRILEAETKDGALAYLMLVHGSNSGMTADKRLV